LKSRRSSVAEHKENTKKEIAAVPINIENTDLKSGSDGIKTEHLEGKGLVQTGL